MIFKPQSVTWILTRPFGRVGISTRDGNTFVHCEISQWDKATKLECDQLWTQFLANIRAFNVGRIYAVAPETDAKLIAFAKAYGFYVMKKYDGYLIMTQEII